MAAIAPAARGDPRALTPPSSSHSDEDPWGRSRQQSQTMQDKNGSVPHESSRSHNRLSIQQYSGDPAYQYDSSYLTVDNSSRKMHSTDDLFGSKWDKAVDSGLSSGPSSYGKQNDIQRVGRSETRGSNEDVKQPQKFRTREDKWIHRDKLAKIENEELQAAGFYVPRNRSRSKPRSGRERSTRRSTDASEEGYGRARHSDLAMGALDGTTGGECWDLRTPEEIAAAEANAYFVQNGSRGGSRIPIARVSPVPIPQDHLERETPATRKVSESPDVDQTTTTSFPKSRTRSTSVSAREAIGHEKDSTPTPAGRARTGTESSKKSTASKKAPAHSKTTSGATGTRPKTRSGSTSTGTTRPRTRSGDPLPLASRAPEGDPPWMFAGFKPDPRLPPEQQIIPTVARRLAQEKWEKEGKFGNMYDKDFRPLNDEPAFYLPDYEDPSRDGPGQDGSQHEMDELTRRPSQDENENRDQAQTSPESPIQNETLHETPVETHDQASEQTQASSNEWPLKADMSKASTMREDSSSSSVPKLSPRPPRESVSSPRASMSPDANGRPKSKQSVQGRVQRVPSLTDAEEEKKAGCACCVVM